MDEPALKVAARLREESSGLLPLEVLKLEDGTAAIVADIGGIDYVLTMTRVPRQRPRPPSN
ncbi:MAG: hypothetical protein LBE86_05385 [Gemmobacter sp.]|nr:hypothetical protein [Gemmobacter sp.]